MTEEGSKEVGIARFVVEITSDKMSEIGLSRFVATVTVLASELGVIEG